MNKLPKAKPRSSKPRTHDEKALMKKVGRKIHKTAYDLGFSRDRLAVEAEVSRSTLDRVLSGEDNIGLCTLHRVSKALGYKNVVALLNDL